MSDQSRPMTKINKPYGNRCCYVVDTLQNYLKKHRSTTGYQQIRIKRFSVQSSVYISIVFFLLFIQTLASSYWALDKRFSREVKTRVVVCCIIDDDDEDDNDNR